MKHLAIILSLLLLLTGCSNSSSSSDSETTLVDMTRYELEHSEELNEYLAEYLTYAEMKEEPIDDWFFDAEKHVLEDHEIIGYLFVFDYEENESLTVDQLNEFLTFAFGEDAYKPIDKIGTSYSNYFIIETDDKKFEVTYYLADDNGVSEVQILRTF